jgi:antibiotic biosynthesis monooxygenase (ABM) superfamily enzyme
MTQITSGTGSTPLAAPSLHMRVLLTWFAIFPLVTAGSLAIAPISEMWHTVLRTFVVTIVVVPLAAYLVIPNLFRLYGLAARRRDA